MGVCVFNLFYPLPLFFIVEVGVSHVSSMFKEADKMSADNTSDAMKDPKNKFSWRKLRGKNPAAGAPGMPGASKGASGESMTTVPMTSFNGVEKRRSHRNEKLLDAVFEGPHKDYMALFDIAGADQHPHYWHIPVRQILICIH